MSLFFLRQDFAEVGEILFNLTRLIIWMVCVRNMMKLLHTRLLFFSREEHFDVALVLDGFQGLQKIGSLETDR